MDTYKLCLKIKLIGESTLKIQLVYVDQLAITRHQLDGLNYHIFRDDVNDICIWSFGQFFINNKALKLPQDNFLSDQMEAEHVFETDGERMSYLKRLYRTLQKWSCDKTTFRDNASNKNDKNINVSDQFWFVY